MNILSNKSSNLKMNLNQCECLVRSQTVELSSSASELLLFIGDFNSYLLPARPRSVPLKNRALVFSSLSFSLQFHFLLPFYCLTFLLSLIDIHFHLFVILFLHCAPLVPLLLLLLFLELLFSYGDTYELQNYCSCLP